MQAKLTVWRRSLQSVVAVQVAQQLRVSRVSDTMKRDRDVLGSMLNIAHVVRYERNEEQARNKQNTSQRSNKPFNHSKL